ncbi:hypothetical protein LCGC14_1735840 [marine sediment metagenome]|uniref:Uncharacterized protein n=1 Tax=marine sediment metagenome TaxID=412755 RepID=A0A0F9HVT8_9ZZZZ
MKKFYKCHYCERIITGGNMDKNQVSKIIEKVLRQDYDRWIVYANECIRYRNAYTCSFYSWKEKNGMIKKDIETLALILSD